MSIQAELERWAASPAGKKKLSEARARALKAGKPLGRTRTGQPVSRALVQQYAEDMIGTILKNLPASLRSSPTPITRDSFEPPDIQLNGDVFSVSIAFKPGAVHRDSLVPNVWDGVENIVVHLSNGWSARGAVHGDWHGIETFSRMEYAGDLFMQEAVEEFNAKHKDALAELGSAYEV